MVNRDPGTAQIAAMKDEIGNLRAELQRYRANMATPAIPEEAEVSSSGAVFPHLD